VFNAIMNHEHLEHRGSPQENPSPEATKTETR
jgi:hypothetical protein